jgi:DNA-binding response OmpR family regulator
MEKQPKIGEILARRVPLRPDQLQEALTQQGRTLLPLASTCLELGYVTEAQATEALSEQYGVPGVCLQASTLSTESLGLVPREVAASHRILPLGVSGGRLQIAMARPDDRAVLDEVSFASGYGALPYVAVRSVLDRAIEAAYDAKARGDGEVRGPEAPGGAPHLEVVTTTREIDIDTSLPGDGLDSFPAASAPEPRPRSDRPLVLAVDDEVEILDIIDKALTHKGIVVLLDAMLPEIHGFELCQQIKQSDRYGKTPVMMISAIYTGWNFIQDVKRIYGADDYMTKPFRVMELVHRVQELLARSQGPAGATAPPASGEQLQRTLRTTMEQLAAGRLQEAVQSAEEAVRTDPFDARAHFVYGTALHRLGRVYEAISEYERVVELAPSQFNALKNLAVLYERQGFKAKAVEMWTRAIAQSPTDAVRKTIKAHLIDLL